MPESEPDVDVLVGRRVLAAREVAGLLQKELGNVLGASYNKIYHIEHGTTNIRVSDVVRVAAALGVPAAHLLQDVLLDSAGAGTGRDMGGETDIGKLIGSRIRAARKAAGLSQRALGQMMDGWSYNKVYTLEQGATRMFFVDAVALAQALDVSPWFFLQDVEDLADLHGFLAARFRDLAIRDEAILGEMLAAIRWIERRRRIELQMPHDPMYYSPGVKPIDFIEEWHNPALAGDAGYLYIQRAEGGRLRGYFFREEIVPSPSPSQQDFPAISSTREWETASHVTDFFGRNGYCWQLYPCRRHNEDYCAPDHRKQMEQ